MFLLLVHCFETIFEVDRIIHGALIKIARIKYKLCFQDFCNSRKTSFSVVFLFQSRTCTIIHNIAINYGEKQDKIEPIEA